MTKPSNTAAIEQKTGLSWAEWVKFLDSKGARDLPHRPIADLAYTKLKDGWWSQAVAVASVTHTKLTNPKQVEVLRIYWKDFIKSL